jgi:hypothetical protein
MEVRAHIKVCQASSVSARENLKKNKIEFENSRLKYVKKLTLRLGFRALGEVK